MHREIRIRYHYESDGSWWADSPDLDRFTAAGSSFEEVRQQAREGARFFTDGAALVVEEGVPEEADASAPDRDVHLVVYEGILHNATSGGGFPTIVMQVDPVGDRVVHVEGAIEDPELVA